MSRMPSASSGSTRRPSAVAIVSVVTDVAAQRMSSSLAARTGRSCATVEPVPRPTFAPSGTSSAAAWATARFSISVWSVATGNAEQLWDGDADHRTGEIAWQLLAVCAHRGLLRQPEEAEHDE